MLKMLAISNNVIQNSKEWWTNKGSVWVTNVIQRYNLMLRI